MSVFWKIINPGPDPPNVVNAIIEIPKGSNIKYEIDHETGVIFVDRVLHTAFSYPFDYGVIPQTWYLDNDPLDIMVLSRISVFPGCVIRARPIAFLRMKDEAGVDNKILAVPVNDPYFAAVKDLSDLPLSTLSEIKHFLEHYKDLEEGKWVKIEGWDGTDAAKTEILKSIALYKENFPI